MAAPTHLSPATNPSSSTTTTTKRLRSASPGSHRPASKRSRSTTPSSKDDNTYSVHATTFGIELEFVFAFKEGLLRSIIAKNGLNADIVKAFSPDEHRNLVATEQIANGGPVPAYDCRERSASWALHVPKTDLTCDAKLFKGMGFIRTKNGKHWVRRYVMEPLLVAKDCLENQGLDIDIVGWIEPHPDPKLRNDAEAGNLTFPDLDGLRGDAMLRRVQVDYKKWTLTNDHTIIGALRSQLHDHLRGQKVSEDDFVNWDSYGVEMISPVYDLAKKDEAIAQVEQYIGSLRTKDTSVLESVWASAHVHIGFNFDKPDDMPMGPLQHLAYILVGHEDLISKCHPRSRSGVIVPEKAPMEPNVDQYDDDEDFDPDKFEPLPTPTNQELEEENEQRALAFEAEYTGVHPRAENVHSNARHLRQHLGIHGQSEWYSTAGAAIFKQDPTIFDLVDLLQHKDDKGNPYRGYMYNFANLVNLARNKTSWKSIKPTVEFRQHACALDRDVLDHWVMLLEAIVHKAENNASQAVVEDMTEKTYAERQASKYLTSTAEAPWPYQNMKLFCTDFLGLDEAEGDYWQERFEKYKHDRPEEVVS